MSDKLIQFKKKLAWKLCSDLLSPQIPSIGSFRPNREDSEEETKLKKIEYDKRVEEIETERNRREPELLDKLNEVIERVRNSRHEKLADNEEVWFTATGSEVERPKLICEVCKNENHLFFITDPHTGDTICLGVDNMGCGNVVQDHFVDEGQQYRKFADDTEDRNHHGPDYDPLMPDSENLKTGIVGTDALFKKLYRTHQEVEMNLSTIGNDDRRTRTAYRNRMKRDAFELMRDISANLSIHKSVLARAKEEFARFRDVREHVHNYQAVIAACLFLAYEDVSAVMDVTIQAPTFSRTEVSGYNILDGLQKIVDSTDPAVATLKNLKIGKWNLDNIIEWVKAVLGENHESATNCIINYLTKTSEKNNIQTGNDNNQNQNINDLTTTTISTTISPNTMSSTDISNSNTIKKRKYPDVIPSFFGSTTISNRKKRYTLPVNNNTLETQNKNKTNLNNSTLITPLTKSNNNNNSNNNHTNNNNIPISLVPLGNESTTFGQKFIVLKFDNLLREFEGSITSEQVKTLKEALKIRLRYEAALDEIAQIESFQQERLRAEKYSSKMIHRDINNSNSQLDIKVENKEIEKKKEENNTNIVIENTNLSEIIEDNDDIWAEVKRVSQIEAAIASTNESLDYSNISSKNHGRRGTNSIFKIA